MKNKIKFLGAFVIMVLVGFSTSACASSDSSEKSSESDSSGAVTKPPQRGKSVDMPINKPIVWRNIKDIAYGDGMFIATGEISLKGVKNRQYYITYSSDGINWTDLSIITRGTHYPLRVSYGGGMFVAGGEDSQIWYSPDGIKWFAHPANKYINKTSYFPSGIAYGNGIFVAVSMSRTATSTDGINWNVRDHSEYSFYGGDIRDKRTIAYGGGRFVSLAERVKVSDEVYRGRYYHSTDGTNWTAYTSSVYVSALFGNGIIYGNGKFISWGGAKIVYSNDGINWVSVENSTFDSPINDIAYGDGRFVAVGRDGKMAYSTDGINWTALLDPAFGFSSIHTITYGGGKFVAVGGGGTFGGWIAEINEEIKIAYSTDGISWTPIPFGSSDKLGGTK